MTEMTPGRTAYEAWWAKHIELDSDDPANDAPPPWFDQADDYCAAWEAAAQAGHDALTMPLILDAVKATPGDTIVIAFNRPVSAQTAHDVMERWKAWAPGMTLLILDDVAAVEAYKPDVP